MKKIFLCIIFLSFFNSSFSNELKTGNLNELGFEATYKIGNFQPDQLSDGEYVEEFDSYASIKSNNEMVIMDKDSVLYITAKDYSTLVSSLVEEYIASLMILHVLSGGVKFNTPENNI
ncbi:hypothetical protein [Cetobacterium sp. SF1]|uniref:hypothetical protein n=1 Tax=unclassified Cetobacterium TaxID=2630983 RepID=UPI003CFA3C3D